jgi:transketolase
VSINTIRTLSIDAVQEAKSRHPGTPMVLAPLVYTVWNRVMNFDPQNPIWPNRDQFVLSNRHASMLLWSILHLTGVQAVSADYELLGHLSATLDDIRRFRQLDSKAPGHPEYHWVSGVETTFGASAPLEELKRKFGFEPEMRHLCRYGVVGPELTRCLMSCANAGGPDMEAGRRLQIRQIATSDQKLRSRPRAPPWRRRARW